MSFTLKTTLLVLGLVIVLVSGNDRGNNNKSRGKRQQIVHHNTRRGGRLPPYAVQMEPIVQYSQRDPLYDPSATSKSDHQLYHDDSTLYADHYSNDPEPIIEIIIKESNESLPPLPQSPSPPPSQTKPAKDPIQVFYVKYEKKKGYGDSKPRVVYDAPIPALTPVENHEEIIETGTPDEHHHHEEEQSHSYATEPPTPAQPSTTLRAIIRPESEVYHSGSSGIRVTFGTEQIPPNNHSKRSDPVTSAANSSITETSSAVPQIPLASLSGSSKRQHGPYHNPQAAYPRVPLAFPQQRIVNSFAAQQQLPPNFPGLNQQFHSQQPNSGPINPTRPQHQQQQRPPITIQGLPDIQQRSPFQTFSTPHRISINHPQQPGFPHALSVSHQTVNLQNQPPSLIPAGNFNSNIQQQPQHQQHQQHHQPQQQHQQQHQQQQQQQHSYSILELEKQRYHQEQRRQQTLRYRELQRQQEQQRLQEQQRKHEEHRIIEQQRQSDQQRHQERKRQEEQIAIQEQQKLHLEQQRRKQEQENKLLQEQQQKYNSQQLALNQAYNRQTLSQQQKPGGEILKAVPKLEQHYAIRENPLHPGPFPPNPHVQTVQYAETGHAQQFTPPIDVEQQRHQQYNTKHQQTFSTNQQSTFSQNLRTPQQQHHQQQQSSIWGGRPVFQENDTRQKIYATPISNSNDLRLSSTARPIYASSTAAPIITTAKTTTTTTTTTPAPRTIEYSSTVGPKNEAKIKENIANLPDEVPDDIRAQLLSSGILGNADIQILDYDKVGGINIENLPPEALANFYGAGGAAATASASEPIPAIAKRPTSLSGISPKKVTLTKVEHGTLRPGGVEMKVVHFEPNTAQGQAVVDRHIRQDATRLKAVVTVGTRNDPTSITSITESPYNRYLPLKVSGASFPIPDAPELQGRKISSVVVLAPVEYGSLQDTDQHNSRADDDDDDNDDSLRRSRMLVGAQPVKFLAGDSLKQLVKKPNTENYKKWLEQESRTEPQKQSVVLLVTTPKDDSHGDKEIFMYDVTSQSVSKLAGDLSSAFVNAAESNSDSSDTIRDSAFTSAY